MAGLTEPDLGFARDRGVAARRPGGRRAPYGGPAPSPASWRPAPSADRSVHGRGRRPAGARLSRGARSRRPPAQRSRIPRGERPPLAAIIFDLGHFSDFNNAWGHQAGDAVLRTFASVLRGRLRATDLVARFGGEEFVAILYRATLEDAMRVAEEVRAQIAATPIDGIAEQTLYATVSAGCSEASDEANTPEALLRAADVALYMAKRAGRDRVVAA